MATQIQLTSQLNPDIWDHYLQGYWDQQLKFLIRYRFPLDFDYPKPLRHENKNHQSAIAFKENVSHYLAEECQFGASLGPFSSALFTLYDLTQACF